MAGLFSKIFGVSKDTASMKWSRTAAPADCDQHPSVFAWLDSKGKKIGEKSEYECAEGTYVIYTQGDEIKKKGYE